MQLLCQTRSHFSTIGNGPMNHIKIMEKDLILIPGNLGEFLIRLAEYKLWRVFNISLLHICGYIIFSTIKFSQRALAIFISCNLHCNYLRPSFKRQNSRLTSLIDWEVCCFYTGCRCNFISNML